MRLTLCFAAHLDLAIALEAARSLLFKIYHAMKAEMRVPATTQLTAIAILFFKSSPPKPLLLVPGLDALDVTAVATESPEVWTTPESVTVLTELDEAGLDIPMVLAMRLP